MKAKKVNIPNKTNVKKKKKKKNRELLFTKAIAIYLGYYKY